MRGSQGLFWGIFLIGIGILMIIKYQFKLNIFHAQNSIRSSSSGIGDIHVTGWAGT